MPSMEMAFRPSDCSRTTDMAELTPSSGGRCQHERRPDIVIWRLALWRGLVFIGASALVCAIVLFVVVTGRPSRPKGYGKDLPPARLVEDFHSYSTVEMVRSKVRERGMQWTVVQEPMNPPTRRNLYYVGKVPNFSHLGVTGDLWFYFFRDRLLAIHFFPPDPGAYWNALVRAEKLEEVRRPNERVRARQGDDVVVWLHVLADERFVEWR